MIALALEVAPCMTWRDVQYGVVASADPMGLAQETFKPNGAGLAFSHRFGFGLLRADRMVAFARAWQHPVAAQARLTVGPQHTYTDVATRSTWVGSLTVRSCEDVATARSDCLARVEQVLVTITVNAARRGDLSVALVSPTGSVSQLLAARHEDWASGLDFTWTMSTVQHWQEPAAGTWQLRVSNVGAQSLVMRAWTMDIFGTLPAQVLLSAPLVQPRVVRAARCAVCDALAYADGQGNCRQCHINCTQGCFGPGPTGCSAFATGDFQEDEPALLQRKQGRIVAAGCSPKTCRR
jgi:hypothetical protein